MPAGAYAIAGTPRILTPNENAMIVSDPIPCQDGDGTIKFK
jgi:hypothetical protein